MRVRRICSCCLRKKYADTMILFYYPLLKREAWHCDSCYKFACSASGKGVIYPIAANLSPQGDNND